MQNSIKSMKIRKTITDFFCASVIVILLEYILFSIHLHYLAMPELLAYIHRSYPDIDESDLCLSCLPMPTSNWDIRIEYSFVYNDYGEKLRLTYYYRNTRPIECLKWYVYPWNGTGLVLLFPLRLCFFSSIGNKMPITHNKMPAASVYLLGESHFSQFFVADSWRQRNNTARKDKTFMLHF